MNETINSIHERWIDSSHVVSEMWLSSCDAVFTKQYNVMTLCPTQIKNEFVVKWAVKGQHGGKRALGNNNNKARFATLIGADRYF